MGNVYNQGIGRVVYKLQNGGPPPTVHKFGMGGIKGFVDIATPLIEKGVDKISKAVSESPFPQQVRTLKENKSLFDKLKDETSFRMYHGTGKVFDKFRSQQSSRGKGVSLAVDPINAESYALGKNPNIRPVDVDTTKFWNPYKPEDVDALIRKIDQHFEKQINLSPYDKRYKPFRTPAVGLSRDQVEKIKQGVREGNTFYLEDPVVSNFIKSLGYKGHLGVEGPYVQAKAFNPESIRSPFESLVTGLSKRGLSGDVLVNAQDTIEDLKEVGADITDEGLVTVYHRTSKENAQKILDSGKMLAKEPDIFFSTSKDSDYGSGFGDHYIKAQIPVEELRLDDIFPGKDASVSVPVKGDIGTLKKINIIGSSLKPSSKYKQGGSVYNQGIGRVVYKLRRGGNPPTVYKFGMGGIKRLVDTATPLIKRGIDKLRDTRLQRAKEMGFDTDTVYYHATDKFEGDVSDQEFTTILPSKKGKMGPGVYMSPDPAYTEKYVRTTYDPNLRGVGKDPYLFAEGSRILPIFVRGKIATREDYFKALEKAPDLLKKEFDELKSATQRNEFGESMVDRQRFVLQKQKAQDILAEDGFSGFKVDKEVVVFDPKNIRSVNAKFEDPDSSVLLKAKGGLVHKFGMGGIKGLVDTATPLIEKGVEAISKAWDERNIKNFISEDKDTITLSQIEVPKSERKKGVGSQAMRELMDYADQTNKQIRVTPDTSFGGTSKDRLRKFYKRFGFVENKGRNKDLSISDSMYREPYSYNIRYGDSGVGSYLKPEEAASKKEVIDTSYRLQHQARGLEEEGTVRLDNLTKDTLGNRAGYPEDFYSPRGQRIYAPGAKFSGDEYGIANTESYNEILRAKGNPEAEVTIYRAVPNEKSITEINEGDFVTLSPRYAELHGASGYGEKGEDAGKLLSKKVKVKDLIWDQNDVNEFGYFPVKYNKGGLVYKQGIGTLARTLGNNDQVHKLAAGGLARAGTSGYKYIMDILDKRAGEMEKPVPKRIQPDEGGYFSKDFTPALEFDEAPLVPRFQKGMIYPLGGRVKPLMDNMDGIVDDIVERSRPYLDSDVRYFYHMGPVLQKARELNIPEKKIKAWINDFSDYVAATSPRTQTDQNVRNAALTMAKEKLGINPREVLGVGTIDEKTGKKGLSEKGYPQMLGKGLEGKLIDRVRSGEGIDPMNNPKPSTFGLNIKGNLEGVTADTHAIRGVLLALNRLKPGSLSDRWISPPNEKQMEAGDSLAKRKKRYKKDPKSLTFDMLEDTLVTQTKDKKGVQAEYSVFSDIYKQVAKKLGVTPAEAQAMSWFSGGDITNLGSEYKTLSQILEDRISVTAKATGKTKDQVFKSLVSKRTPLLSVAPLLAPLLSTGRGEPETNKESDAEKFEDGGVVPPLGNNGQVLKFSAGGIKKLVDTATPFVEKGIGSLMDKIRPAEKNLLTVLGLSNKNNKRVVGDEMVPIDSLNERRFNHPDHAKRIGDLIEKMARPDGYVERLIIDQDDSVVKGQHRLQALRGLGETMVPVTRVTDDFAPNFDDLRVKSYDQAQRAKEMRRKKESLYQLIGNTEQRLPMDNASRMKRAEEMGFSMDAYHGTIEDIDKFETPMYGKSSKLPDGMTAFTDNPIIAETYTTPFGIPTRKGQQLNRQEQKIFSDFDSPTREKDLEKIKKEEDLERASLVKGQVRGSNIIPVKLRLKNPMIIDADNRPYTNVNKGGYKKTDGKYYSRDPNNEDAEILSPVQEKAITINEMALVAQEAGHDGLIVKRVVDSASPLESTQIPATTTIVFDPSNIRSRFAEFDPAKKDLSGLNMKDGGVVPRSPLAMMGQGYLDRGKANLSASEIISPAVLGSKAVGLPLRGVASAGADVMDILVGPVNVSTNLLGKVFGEFKQLPPDATAKSVKSLLDNIGVAVPETKSDEYVVAVGRALGDVAVFRQLIKQMKKATKEGSTLNTSLKSLMDENVLSATIATALETLPVAFQGNPDENKAILPEKRNMGGVVSRGTRPTVFSTGIPTALRRGN